jgi:hypothetical protein
MQRVSMGVLILKGWKTLIFSAGVGTCLKLPTG